MNRTPSMTALEETPARFTAEEFIELAQQKPIVDWSGKVELVDGIIVRMSPAKVPHWNAQRVIYDRLYEAIRGVEGGWIVGLQPAVRLAADCIREPDVALLQDPDLSGPTIDRTALHLAIEVSDTSLATDLGAKSQTYAAAHVPHYWVVDLKNRLVHVMHSPRRGDYSVRQGQPFGTELRVPGTNRSIVIE